MTQPVRLKVSQTNTNTEKPPIDMKLLAKRIFSRCIPCIRLSSRDEKLLLTHQQNTLSSEFDE
jgi:hypothetical protein